MLPGDGPDPDSPDGEVEHVSIRVSLAPGTRDAEPNLDAEPCSRIDHEALSFHPERLLLLPDAEEDDVEVGPEAWFVEDRNGFDVAHCLTLVEGVGVDDVLDRLRARGPRGTSGFADLLDDAQAQSEEDDDLALVGAADLGRWTLLVESNDFVATLPKRRRALSRGTTTVTLFAGINSASECSVTVDGEVRLTFDPMFPEERDGTRPDDFVDDLLAAGLVLDGVGTDDAGDGDEEDDGSADDTATLAFVERITGVRLTVGLLAGLVLRTGVVRR